MILNCVHDITVTIFHLKNLILFQKADEDILVLRCYSNDHTQLVTLQPAPITSNLCLAIIFRAKQDGVGSFDVWREASARAKTIHGTVKVALQQQLGEMLSCLRHS